jgi:hypothetical protein
MLPSNIYDVTNNGRKSFVARRMSGASPTHWYGQSPTAIRSVPHPALIPFTLIVLPETESPQDYHQWAASSPLRPTIVAASSGDLSYDDLTLDGLQAHFLKVCDSIPSDISPASIDAARIALREWKTMPERKLRYHVGGHNSVIPNVMALNPLSPEVMYRLESE